MTIAKRVPRSAKRKRTISKTPEGAWLERRVGTLRVLQVREFLKYPWLVHGFSTRPGGASTLEGEQILNLGFTEWDSREKVLENRRRFLAALDAEDLSLIPLSQFHSDVVHAFESPPEKTCRGDASVTASAGLLLGVQTADCVPILLVDPETRAVAAVHAGWRGTLQRILAKTIGRMQMEFHTNPANLLAAIGPAIGSCCYEVGAEVASAFQAQFANAAEFFDELRTGDEPNPLQWLNMMPPGHQPPPKGALLDLRKANHSQLLSVGLHAKNIFINDLCTACSTDLLFSHRKERGRTGRIMSVIGVRN